MATREELLARKEQIETRLEELRAIDPSDIQVRKYLAAADVMAEYDPKLALEYSSKADELSKAPKTKDPETVRFKLMSALNQVNSRIANTESDDPNLASLQRLAASIQKQISMGTPSAQAAFLESLGDGALTGGTGKEPATKEEVVAPEEDVDETLKPNTTMSNETIFRRGKESTTYTDWVNDIMVDGALKPVVRGGADIRNASDRIQKQYDKDLAQWNRSTDTAKRLAEEKKVSEKGAEIAKRLSVGIPKTLEKLSKISTQITSLIDKFNKGDYNLANFADLKNTMADGKMTDGDVGLALGLSTAEGFVQNIKSWATGGKGGLEQLNDKDAARAAINRTINEYNKTISNILNPRFVGKYKEAAQKEWLDNSYSTPFASLPKSFSKIPGGTADTGGGNKTTEKPTERTVGGFTVVTRQ